MLRKIILLFSFILIFTFCKAQNDDSLWTQKSFVSRLTSIPPKPHKARLVGISSTYAAAWGGSIVALNEIWYKGYPKTSFHTFNDAGEWLQVDKVGHAYSAYRLGLGFSSILQWGGLEKKKSVYIGALSGVVSQSVIEILDGYSAKWGFSYSDMTANILGSGLYAGQYALWGEQRILFKFSTHQYHYPTGILSDRARNLYGATAFELIFKDYNAQTYWLSANLKSFAPKSKIPAWLNMAVGYGADGMYGGNTNQWTDKNGISFNRADIPRLRQFYFAPDIDWSRVPVKSKWLHAVLSTLNLKTPLPTLEILQNGKIKFHPLYF